MEPNKIQIPVNGRLVEVPGLRLQNRTVVVMGKWAKAAVIHDEDWLSGPAVVNPPEFIDQLRASSLPADWFTFAQKFTDIKPRHPYRFEWDNIAAIPIISFNDWWERRVSHDLRKDVKRAEKRGLTVQPAEFDDQLVRGIRDIYNELPIRQGRRFWHYGKDFEAVKRENSSYLERSQFIGAYHQEELIGFIKIVYVDDVARMMQILSKEAHQDKRPGNALIAKAVELAYAKGCSYLTYGRYTYGNKRNSSFVQFKRRNGFEEILFPRYYIPLTNWGSLLIQTGFHRELSRWVPERLLYFLLEARSKARELTSRRPPPQPRALHTGDESASTPSKAAVSKVSAS